jgi:hypothetical protein
MRFGFFSFVFGWVEASLRQGGINDTGRNPQDPQTARPRNLDMLDKQWLLRHTHIASGSLMSRAYGILHGVPSGSTAAQRAESAR